MTLTSFAHIPLSLTNIYLAFCESNIIYCSWVLIIVVYNNHSWSLCKFNNHSLSSFNGCTPTMSWHWEGIPKWHAIIIFLWRYSKMWQRPAQIISRIWTKIVYNLKGSLDNIKCNIQQAELERLEFQAIWNKGIFYKRIPKYLFMLILRT